jgi:Domain of unknown function (DUF1883)
MNYVKFPLQYQTSGAVVEVMLSGVESDVFLIGDINLSAFEHGGQFRYYGGHYRSSPVRLRVPSNGNWTVVVIPGAGTVRASVRVLATI